MDLGLLHDTCLALAREHALGYIRTLAAHLHDLECATAECMTVATHYQQAMSAGGGASWHLPGAGCWHRKCILHRVELRMHHCMTPAWCFNEMLLQAATSLAAPSIQDPTAMLHTVCQGIGCSPGAGWWQRRWRTQQLTPGSCWAAALRAEMGTCHPPQTQTPPHGPGAFCSHQATSCKLGNCIFGPKPITGCTSAEPAAGQAQKHTSSPTVSCSTTATGLR